MQRDYKIERICEELSVPCFACEHLQNTDHTDCDFCLGTGLLRESEDFFTLTTNELLFLLKFLPKDEAIVIAEKRKEHGDLYMLQLTASEKYLLQMAAIDNWCSMDRPLWNFVIPHMNDDGTIMKFDTTKNLLEEFMNEISEEIKNELPEDYEERHRKLVEEENRKFDNLIEELKNEE